MSLLVCGGIFVEEIAGRPRRMGGSGLTAALAAARYGAEVSLAGWVGTGEADEAFALLDAAGVDHLGVEVLEGTTTTYRIADPADLAMPVPGVIVGAVPRGGAPALPSSRVLLCFGTPGFDAVRARWLDRAADGGTLLFDRQGSQSMIFGAAMAATIPAARRILLANVFEAATETKRGSLMQAVADLPPDGYAAAVIKAGAWGVLVVESGGEEQPFGAHDVAVRSTIGSGDVFAGVLAASIAGGADLTAATPTATAAAAAWIAGGNDQPRQDLPARAQAIGATPSVWVDRRRLEALRFAVSYDAGLECRARERIGRGLRYLGMETMHTMTDKVAGIDLRCTGEATDPVTAAITQTIGWAREAFGVTRLDRGR